MAQSAEAAGGTTDAGGARYLAAIALAAALALAAVWAYATLRPMAFLESGYPVWKAKHEMIGACDLGALAVFGDSQADSAFIPERMPMAATNLGFAGGTPIENHYFVKRALACGHRADFVLLSFGPSALGLIQPWLWQNAVRYGMLGATELGEIRSTAAAIGDPTYLEVKTREGLTGLQRDIVYQMRVPSIYFNSLVEGRVFLRAQQNEAKFREVRAARGYPNYGAGGGGLPGAAIDAFQPLPLQQRYLEDTVAMFGKAGVPVHFLITPLSRERFGPAGQQPLDDYLAFLRRIEARHPNFRLLQDRVPLWPKAMFVDGAHLTKAGAETFTDLLARCMAARSTKDAAPARCAFALD